MVDQRSRRDTIIISASKAPPLISAARLLNFFAFQPTVPLKQQLHRRESGTTTMSMMSIMSVQRVEAGF